jgi:hypothetical protein
MNAKNPGRKKGSTDTVIAARVEEVLQLRLNGAEFYDLKAHAKEQGWDVTDRTLWRYSAAADDLLAESLEKDREKLLRRHLAQRRSLYARALQDGDYRTGLAILRDEADLHGLYPAKKVQMSGATAPAPEAMTDAERAAAIQQIHARFGLPPGSAGGPASDRNGSGNGDGPILG